MESARVIVWVARQSLFKTIQWRACVTASGFDVKLDVRLYYSNLVIVSSADTLLYLMCCVLTKRLRQAHRGVYKRVLRPCFAQNKTKKERGKKITLTSPLNIFNIANNQIL